MTRLSVLTPSYGPDLELCRDLNRSVIRHFPESVAHDVIVSARDFPLFEGFTGGRTRLHTTSEFLPREFVSVPGRNVWVNVRRPYPPVRGWILQQIVKLAAAARSEADVVLLADSDIVFLRSVAPASYCDVGMAVLYRKNQAVDRSMPRHVRWHAVARQLLGLPSSQQDSLPDYIGAPIAWSPRIVRAMLARVEEINGKPWPRVIASQLHFSEMILYGVYVDEVMGSLSEVRVTDDDYCVTYWDDVPLEQQDVLRLLESMRPSDNALMLSAKSRTPLTVRRSALACWGKEGA